MEETVCRNGSLALTLGLCVTVSGAAFAQTRKTLTDKDRAEIRQLSDNYVTFLDGCKAAEYAEPVRGRRLVHQRARAAR